MAPAEVFMQQPCPSGTKSTRDHCKARATQGSIVQVPLKKSRDHPLEILEKPTVLPIQPTISFLFGPTYSLEVALKEPLHGT